MSKKTGQPASERVKLSKRRVDEFQCPPGKSQAFLWDDAAPGFGLRVTRNGKKAYIFQGRLGDSTMRLTIGAVEAWAIDAARKEARRLQSLIDTGTDPRNVKQAAIDAEAKRRKATERAKDAEQYTVQALLTAYTEHLEANGKGAHKDARSIFTLHLFKPFPKVAALPANALTDEQVADAMRRLHEQGKGRTANKLRSYIRAAYALARSARTSAKVPVLFKAFNITANPASDTEPDSTANRPDKNPLLRDDLAVYWSIIKDLPAPQGPVLRLHLLLGGQRPAQLVRLKPDDVSLADGRITLFDGKGRAGAQQRRHILPLTERAKAELSQAIETLGSGADWVLSSDGGKTHIHATTLTKWAKEAVGERIAGFELKRVRSGVETLLASCGVNQETRGYLQSHGIAGVQARNYNAWEYLPEKLQALELLHSVLSNAPAKVLPIKAAGGRV